jgi:outer membrane protein assembly factor BamB
MSELDAPHLGRGYGASPIAYKDLVIVNAGAPGAAVVAFRQDNGEIVWKSGDFGSTYTSPVLGQLDDKDVLIVAMGNHRAGLDPATGAVRWSHEVDRKMRTTMSTPIWGDDGILFTSSAYDGETQVFRVAGSEGAYGVEQLWSHRKMRVHFGNAVRVGDFVYGSSGDFGPSFLMCADLKTGELKWRSREVGKSTLLSLGGGRMLLLDEDGNLALADCTPEGVKIQSKAKLLENQAWTVPTLIGTKLYLRDRKTMMAVELGA